ncbi:MAG: hypothetical protein JWP00_4685 [Chloroflexi bacterium]|nr:hypothetical protein [Chloroflexota bacterium]
MFSSRQFNRLAQVMVKIMQPTTKPAFSGWLSRLFHSVRFRLSLWYVIILALVVLVFGSVIYSVEAASLSGEIDAELKFIAEKIPMALAPESAGFKLQDQVTQFIDQFFQRKLPDPIVSQLQGVPLIEGLMQGKFTVALVDPQGQLTQSLGALDKSQLNRLTALADTGTPEGRFAVFTATSSGQASQDYRVYIYPIQKNNRLVGTVFVGLPWEGAATLRVLLLALLLTGAVTLTLAAAGGYWLASRAMSPVSDITRTARNISETDLSRRLNSKRQDEIGELAGTFDGMLSRLQAAFERQRQFTADASHELRTPLTIINLEVSRALARQRSPEEYEKALWVIRVENDYMTQLVEDLLILARADAGQATLNTEQLDLSDLSLEVVERLAPLAAQQGITLRTGELPEVLVSGDRHYLTRLLANLVENAIKYTAGTGDSVRVETGYSHDNDRQTWAWLRVTDNGPGIAPEHQPHLFDRFYQAENSRSTAVVTAGNSGKILSEEPARGSGLGLAIVKWVAEAHRGSAAVHSQPGQGATFEVRLPGEKVQEEEG